MFDTLFNMNKEDRLLTKFESLIKKKHFLGSEIIEIEEEIDEAMQQLRRLYRYREHRNEHGKSTS